jgi:tRNA threonylcarbamoyladenosine dehydratase
MTIDELRFAGVARLYGREGAERLAAAHVAVVGIGGVGSWVAEALVRSGVGEISLFDLDDVCLNACWRLTRPVWCMRSPTLSPAKP